jgi:hypothetical protein
MSKIIIKESELVKLIETAMDLYRYTQSVDFPTGDDNESLEETIDSIINRLKELLFMLKSGKKIDYTNKSELFSQLDDINSFFEKIKYDK